MLTYNRASYIRVAIESVLQQTYRNWKLLIIDDGSTDTTSNIVRSFDDQRIKYIRHEHNAGLHVRREESLGVALGDTQSKYIAVLDSDDLWHDTQKLQMQVDFLESHPDHVVVGTYTKLIDANGANIGFDTFAPNDERIRADVLIRNQFTHSAVCMRRTAIEQTNGYQPTLAEDLELILQLGLIGKLANIPEYMTSHRIHVNSVNDYGIKMANAVHDIIKDYRTRYPHYWQGYIKNVMRKLRGILLRN